MPTPSEEKLYAVLIADLNRFEGRYRHMYLDVKDLVTTGIGNLVASPEEAVKLPFLAMPSGLPADAAAKRYAWSAVKAMPPGLRARAYEAASALRLSEAAVDELVVGRLEREFLPHLRARLPGFDSFPMQAKEALVDIAYNCGTGGFDGFHHLLEAAARQDWALAAKSCHRAGARDDRNTWTISMFTYAGFQPLFA